MLKSIFMGITLFATFIILSSCGKKAEKTQEPAAFVTIQGQNLIKPDGSKLFIMGTNLGNWLNPEGYMFKFNKTNSPRFINEMFCQLVGPDFTAEFWKAFKDNYITGEDIRFIKSTGANTIRLPFHYKLFTDEDFMGLTANQDGFARIDSIVKWCRETGLYLILDMHDAPGGQTGDNIDDSYGYPWLFEELNGMLENTYKKGVAAIREVDTNHIILLGGAQWNGNFKPFKDFKFDDKIMYTCHRYGGEPTKAAIQQFIDFRDSVNRPMYMGEIGHNTDEWQAAFCRTMQENNIGYTFWPYKKMEGSGFTGIVPPKNWDIIVRFSEAPRTSYKEIRAARPDQTTARTAMTDFIEASKLKNCVIQERYIQSLKMK